LLPFAGERCVPPMMQIAKIRLGNKAAGRQMK
jgi:hypothetical protein